MANSHPRGRARPRPSVLPLARALSHLHRRSGHTVRTIAVWAGLSPSYVHRMTSGERRPSWDSVTRFAQACDASSEDFAYLWGNARRHRYAEYAVAEAEHRIPTPGIGPALRGLHLAAGQPSPEPLLARITGVSPRDQALLAVLLSRDGKEAEQPTWAGTAALARALRHDARLLRPVWEASRTAATAREARLPASSFG